MFKISVFTNSIGWHCVQYILISKGAAFLCVRNIWNRFNQILSDNNSHAFEQTTFVGGGGGGHELKSLNQASF